MWLRPESGRAGRQQRRSQGDAQAHLKRHLHISDICCHAGDKARRTEFVYVGKRKGLDIFKHTLARVAGKAGRSGGREPSGQDTKY